MMPIERRVRGFFRFCAIYGFCVLPLVLLGPPWAAGQEVRIGFVGVALVFQWVFWIIADDPRRYHRLMLSAVAEKLVFAIPALVLVAQHRAAASLAPFAAIDLAMGFGFALSWRAIGRSA